MNSKHLIAAILLCCPLPYAFAGPPIQPGDHIAIVGNTFADQLRIHGYLETMLLQHTIDNPVSIRNLGWGGDMLNARDRPTGFATEESTLSAHKTDVIIACFGMGESFAGQHGIAEFERLLKGFVDSHSGKQYNGKSTVRLILVSPIACEDHGKLTPERDQRNSQLEAYTQAMRQVAATASVPFVDLYEQSRYLMDEPTGPKLTTNGIHLNDYGYWAISHTFFNQLTAQDRVANHQPWRLQIDVATGSTDARGVGISKLAKSNTVISFSVTETSAPRLPPPTSHTVPPQLKFVRDTLVVENLKPGTYQLTINDKPITSATAEAWAEGIAVDDSPIHRATTEYRRRVNDKNLQFTYSWKALNQVHIVGERRTSPSGKRLPGEVIEFNKLADKQDKALSSGVKLQTRQWRISKVEIRGEESIQPKTQ